MEAADVLDIYRTLDRAGIAIWLDGGWCVDALLGRQTRPHADLDIAVEARSCDDIMATLRSLGYGPADATREWNFILNGDRGRKIDVHAFVLDAHGNGVLGPPDNGDMYPSGALSGEGMIAGIKVRCIAARFMLQFKSGYPPRDIDRADIAALRALIGLN